MVGVDDDASSKAIAEKDVGNAFYKKKEFEKALESYNRAIQLDPTNITFYTNKAAVFFEQGEHEKCRETCLVALDIGRSHKADRKLVAKAYARIGNSFLKQKAYVEAIDFFKKSLTTNETQEIWDKLNLCEKEIKEQEKLAYINPDVAQEEKIKGDEAFQADDFENSLKHYAEAIKRSPNDAKLYSSRAAVYMRLLKFSDALEDCENCVQKDPNYVKGHICKGAALESLAEFDKAMDSYQKALELDPNAKEATVAYYRCLDKDYKRRNSPDSARKRAMENQEVNELLSDPEIKKLMEKTEKDLDALREHVRSPKVAQKLQKLVEYGLIKVS